MMLETLILEQNPRVKRWVVAYSGGLDSTVLLHLVATACRELPGLPTVSALHINHQLSPQAVHWQRHCQQQCEQWGLEFSAHRVTVDAQGRGIEAAAREQRYRVFNHCLDSEDGLLMGHHQDDQAETFLLRLMRGAGVLGLTAMRAERVLDGGALLLRPLLAVSRQQLLDYATRHHLQWIEDESNQSLAFDRNFVRHQLVPLIQQRWPQATKQWVKTAAYLQESQTLLQDLADMDLQQADGRAERYGVSLDWQAVSALSRGRIANLLRYWCQCQQQPLPDSQQMQQIDQQFFSASALLSSALVCWGGCELRQFHRRLFLMTSLPAFVKEARLWQWQGCNNIDLGGAGELLLAEGQSGACRIARDKIEDKVLTIRWRQGGERCTPAGRSASQTVKKLLQEYQLETWLRDRVPLIYCDQQLVAVGDLWVCQDYAADNHQEGLSLSWSL